MAAGEFLFLRDDSTHRREEDRGEQVVRPGELFVAGAPPVAEASTAIRQDVPA